MGAKLTLRMDPHLIEAAKKYAAKSGRSLSEIVAEYFRALLREDESAGSPISPAVRSLKGALKNIRIDEKDYKKYLEEKYS